MTIRHLYVHVPFCVRRCGYCDFAVTATRDAPVHAWLEGIAAELALRTQREGWAAPLPLETIYVGGGTPSMLGTGAMAALAGVLRRHAVWTDDVEWTCEANPESFDAALAEDWVRAGVNRISLGAQTFHEPTLRWMGRLHGADGPARALGAARDAGLDNVSIDLIFGVPSRLGRDWSDDLERTSALGPAHISLYGLTAEAGTPLGRWVEAGRERLADEDRYAAEYLLAAERLGAAGFEHYEVSNFARPGRASRHNRAYWDHRAYIGLGPGAHSYLPPVRSWNVRDWAEYRQMVEAGTLPRQDGEVLDERALALETVWLGLRSDRGLRLEQLTEWQRARTEAWVAAGWAVGSGGARPGDDGAVRLTAAGWLLLDRLSVELASEQGG